MFARGFWLSPGPSVAASPLEVSLAALHFGEVVESADFQHEVRLCNVSSAPLTVRLENMCDCAGVEPKTLQLEPGQTGRVTMRLDLLHNRLLYAGQTVRPYRAHVNAYYGDQPGDRYPLTVTGAVRAILDMWPPNLHLKDELIEGEDSAEESVTITPVMPLQWLVVKHAPPPSYLDSRLEAGEKKYTLRVRVKAGMPRGWFSQNVVLQMADAKGKPLPEQMVQVTGTVAGRFTCVPAETTFGIRAVGSLAEQVVQVRSRKCEPFTVVRAIAKGDRKRVEPMRGDGKETSVRVVQRIEKAGMRRESVAFVVHDARGKDHEVEYWMLYYGTEAK